MFFNNTAILGGAGIYANDMSRCTWLGSLTGNHTIFEIPPNLGPFYFTNNTVQSTSVNTVTNHNLATDASHFSSLPNVSILTSLVLTY